VCSQASRSYAVAEDHRRPCKHAQAIDHAHTRWPAVAYRWCSLESGSRPSSQLRVTQPWHGRHAGRPCHERVRPALLPLLPPAAGAGTAWGLPRSRHWVADITAAAAVGSGQACFLVASTVSSSRLGCAPFTVDLCPGTLFAAFHCRTRALGAPHHSDPATGSSPVYALRPAGC